MAFLSVIQRFITWQRTRRVALLALVAALTVAAAVVPALLADGAIRDVQGFALLVSPAAVLGGAGALALIWQVTAGQRHSRLPVIPASQAILYDPLSGLPGSALFEDRLTRSLARSDRLFRSTVALAIDVEPVEGVPLSPEQVREIAARLAATVRAEDTVSGPTGNTFLVVLEDLQDDSQATQVVERILVVLRRPIEEDGDLMAVRAWVGAARSQPRRHTAADLLKGARQALEQAHREGNWQVAFQKQLSSAPTSGTAAG